MDDDRSPLFLARHSLAMTRSLLKHGADVNVVNPSHGFTALHMVARFGEEDVVGALVEAGADVSARPFSYVYFGHTPLHNTASGGNLGGMSALLRHGAVVNAVDRNGETPLHCGCATKKLLGLMYSTRPTICYDGAQTKR